MVQLWWAVAAAAVPVVFIRNLVRNRDGDGNSDSRNNASSRRKRDGKRGGVATADDALVGGDSFVCERVCASRRLLNRMGPFSKDPTPNTCVTVCGVSDVDSCTEACRRVVCVNPHHVPNWNDGCMRRCQDECLRGLAR
ncbi:hypothetical protein CLOM_g23114 [Closterium sp. NIES-68]|nr:hypothetical protein CLOM_g23114 [Closterium sp. NIES-68]